MTRAARPVLEARVTAAACTTHLLERLAGVALCGVHLGLVDLAEAAPHGRRQALGQRAALGALGVVGGASTCRCGPVRVVSTM